MAVAIAGMACSSTVTLTQPVTPKQPFSSPDMRVLAQVGDVAGATCFRDELGRALAAPGGIQLASGGSGADLSLSGRVSRIEVHSNRGDKEVSLLYFSAFVITAPIAAAMYGAKDWNADAAAEGELVAADRAGRVVWRAARTVAIGETQRTMPSHDALKTAMEGAVCRKLAVTLLNALTDAVTADPTLVAR